MQKHLSRAHDKVLFTPGPLTTSQSVKQAMIKDFGSRDKAFIDIVADVRRRLLAIGNVSPDEYTAVLMQGSGTFGIESVFSSIMPHENAKLLIIENGAYGQRVAQMAKVLKIPFELLSCPENQTPNISDVTLALSNPEITHVTIVHCETTTGIMNPIEKIGKLVHDAKKTYIVDAMSSFGAVPINIATCKIDYLISSANKCIEGVPGFAFAICKTSKLMATEGFARSLSLDLLAQYKGLENNGQFRFTPPTHAILAFHQALLELEIEGGVEGRQARYQDNCNTLAKGMRELGFKEYLSRDDAGHIITSFLFPENRAFNFEDFYTRLSERGFLIYPGKVSDAQCFRIANIGRIFKEDVLALINAIREY